MTGSYKLLVVNFAGACFVVWAAWLGYVARVMEGDVAHMSEIMAGLFVIGLIWTFRLSWKIAAVRDKTDMTSKGKLKAIRALLIHGEHLGVVAASLFILSIIGNAIGIKTGFHGIDVQALASPEGVLRLGAQVLSGASATFGSTIIGATLSLWTTFNAMLLYTEMRLLELDAS